MFVDESVIVVVVALYALWFFVIILDAECVRIGVTVEVLEVTSIAIEKDCNVNVLRGVDAR